jgi:hypothetical protein
MKSPWCKSLTASLPLAMLIRGGRQQLSMDSETPMPALSTLFRRLRSTALRTESGSYTADLLRIAIQVVNAFFSPLGCICRRQMRSSPMSLPRFSGEDSSVLSSVMLPPYLQLKLIPRWSLPSRLLAEPLALRLAGLLEAPEDHSYMFISSVFFDSLFMQLFFSV